MHRVCWTMNDTVNIEEAMSRFEAALTRIEAAMEKSINEHARLEATGGEVEALRKDRSRLVEELGNAREKTKRLLEVNTEADRRIGMVMERLKSVLSGT